MLRFRERASVHQLHAPTAETFHDAKVMSIIPLLEREAENAKPYSKFYYTDLIGRFNKWRGKPVQDAQPGTPNYNQRRTIVESPLVLAGLAGAIALASLAYNTVVEDDKTPAPSHFLAPEFKVVSGSQASANRVTIVDVSVDGATYYEEEGDVLCEFKGLEVHNATAGSSASDVVTYTDGTNFELNYSSDCYNSATLYVEDLNQQGFYYSVHNPKTFDSNMPNGLLFPSTVTVEPL